MKIINQILAVTLLNLRSLPQRIGSSIVIVIGIAGVVAVLVSVLAMSTGMLKSMQGAGREDRAIVLRTGSSSEMSSNLGIASALKIMDAPGVKHDDDGNAIASAEAMSIVLLTKKDGTEVSVPMRGVGKNAFKLRPEIEIIEGRMFEPAVYELIVGKNAQSQYAGLDIGSEVKLRSATWKVVGTFSSGGDTHESEIMVNAETMLTAMRRPGSVSSVTLQLESKDAFQTFKDAITTDPTLAVDVHQEKEFFSKQSEQISLLLSIVAYFVGGIMAVGAVFAALNTMYSAVSNRAVEIATLRAIGFGGGPIVTSVLVEAMLLAFIGGVIGAFIGWLLFNGHTVSTVAASTGAPETRVFSLYVSPGLIITGITLAWLIGFFGGLFPAVRAARMPVATALREM